MPTLTPPPPAPSILDPENFSERADAFVAWVATFVAEMEALIGTTIPAGSAAAITLTGTTLAANVIASSLTSLGSGAFATQAQQEAASSVAVVVSPGRQHYHPSAAKFWAFFNTAGAVSASYNTTSITDNGVGDATVNIATDFSGSSWSPFVVAGSQGSGHFANAYTITASTVRVQNFSVAPALIDPQNGWWSVGGFGDQ